MVVEKFLYQWDKRSIRVLILSLLFLHPDTDNQVLIIHHILQLNAANVNFFCTNDRDNRILGKLLIQQEDLFND
jgi:hypothetical protein